MATNSFVVLYIFFEEKQMLPIDLYCNLLLFWTQMALIICTDVKSGALPSTLNEMRALWLDLLCYRFIRVTMSHLFADQPVILIWIKLQSHWLLQLYLVCNPDRNSGGWYGYWVIVWITAQTLPFQLADANANLWYPQYL